MGLWSTITGSPSEPGLWFGHNCFCLPEGQPVKMDMKLRAGCSRDHLKITILKRGSDVSLTLTIYSQREKAYSVQPRPNTVWSDSESFKNRFS